MADSSGVVAELKQGRKPAYGFLGVGPELLDVGLRSQGRHGSLVASVVAGTPAAVAALRPGDLITHIDGQVVYDDDDLIRLPGVNIDQHFFEGGQIAVNIGQDCDFYHNANL